MITISGGGCLDRRNLANYSNGVKVPQITPPPLAVNFSRLGDPGKFLLSARGKSIRNLERPYFCLFSCLFTHDSVSSDILKIKKTLLQGKTDNVSDILPIKSLRDHFLFYLSIDPEVNCRLFDFLRYR